MNKSSVDQRERAGSQQCWSLMETRQKLTASNYEASLIEQFPAIVSAQRHTGVIVSYVFIVVKTHVRPFAVSGILSQLAWIWAFSWRDTLRKMWFTICSTHLTNTYNNSNLLTFNNPLCRSNSYALAGDTLIYFLPDADPLLTFKRGPRNDHTFVLCSWWLDVIFILCPWQHKHCILMRTFNEPSSLSHAVSVWMYVVCDSAAFALYVCQCLCVVTGVLVSNWSSLDWPPWWPLKMTYCYTTGVSVGGLAIVHAGSLSLLLRHWDIIAVLKSICVFPCGDKLPLCNQSIIFFCSLQITFHF